MAFRRFLLRISAVLVLLAPVACYEGWEAETYGGPGDEEPPGPTGPKPIYYILYQPIYLNQNGISDDYCFSKTGIREYRQNEWASRSAALQKALTDLAEKVVVADLGISADDCDMLTLVRNASVSSNPWGSDAPGTDPLGRPLIHVKAVFYDGEPLFTPPNTVRQEHWAAFEDLVFGGVDARSRHYFVLANPDDGYFSEWRNGLPASSQMNGTVINDIDPTPDGIAARDSVISSDTAAFSTWVVQ